MKFAYYISCYMWKSVCEMACCSWAHVEHMLGASHCSLIVVANPGVYRLAGACSRGRCLWIWYLAVQDRHWNSGSQNSIRSLFQIYCHVISPFSSSIHAFFSIPVSRVLDSSISSHVLVLFFLYIFLSRVAWLLVFGCIMNFLLETF